MYERREQQWIEEEDEEGNVLKCQYSHREWDSSYMYIALDGTHLSDFPSVHSYICMC